jgi:acyl dehydratase
MATIDQRQRALIGKELSHRDAPYGVNEAMARFWCEMVEDANPIYFDEAYAGATWLEGTFAPPAMLFTWIMQPVWPEVERETVVGRLALTDCPSTIAVHASQQYLLPVRYGDRLTATTQISALSDEKSTRLGVGHFVTTVDTIRNQAGEVVGTHTFTLFVYRPHAAKDGA